MSKIKKLIALTLALAMVLSVSAFAGSYSENTYADADKINADCEEAVELLYALDIMVGDGKNFNPESAVTRAEMAKMIYVILNYGKDDKAVTYTGGKFFSDVEAGYWAEGYINYCASTKLIAGRGDGKFDPTAPVTTAEAAKMLLTAIGYSAEARGYTGANWDKNVLSDAAVIGLLKGYKSNVNTYAPRQWVAVMIENMLLDAYTFGTMAPSFSGLLVSGEDVDYDKMGEKYYGLSAFEAVAVATPNASIDTAEWKVEGKTKTQEFASNKYVLFSNGKEIKGTGLKAADLGQEYRVIHDGTTAYSVRSLSDVAEARLLDIETEVKYGTSSNKANNKYEFTIEDMVAKFADKDINVLYTGTDDYAEKASSGATRNSRTGARALNVIDFYETIEAPTRTNDLYKAIDVDCDGDIDYMIVTEYAYAEIVKDGSHNKYGDFVKANVITNAYTMAEPAERVAYELTFNGEVELYLDDCIISEDDLTKGAYVKYTWDLDEGMFAMEVLPEAEDVVYESRVKADGLYTLGGDEYQVADKGWANELYAWLNGSNLDDAVCFVYDGDLLVDHWFSDSDYTDMADINAQLVVVMDVENEYSNNTIREQNAIQYLTIDGDVKVAVYQDKDGYVQFSDIDGTGEGSVNLRSTAAWADLKGRLFILHEGTKGRVYLEELSNEGADPNAQLDASTSLLNEYEIVDGVTLDATKTAVKLDNNTMASENPFFYAYIDDNGTSKTSDDEPVYGIIKPSEMGKGKDTGAYAQTLNYVKSPSGRTTVLGGYLVFDLTSATSGDYVYITEVGQETAAGQEVTVQFVGGEEMTITVVNGEELYTNLLYICTETIMSGEYELELIDKYDATVDGNTGAADWNKGFWSQRVVSWYDEDYTLIHLAAKKAANDLEFDISDDDYVDNIVIVTIEDDRDETQGDYTDEDFLYEEDIDCVRTLEVVAYDEIAADDIEHGADTDSYAQSAYWYYDAAEDLLYIVVVRDMTRAH